MLYLSHTTQRPDGSAVAPAAHAGGTVLLVDDEGPARDELAQTLRDLGFTVAVAACGEPAVEEVGRIAPDAVVVDMCRTGPESADLCTRLKDAAPTGVLRVLHLSPADMSSEDRAHVLDVGADGYLTPPFTTAELRASLSALVRLARRDRARVDDISMNSVLSAALDSLDQHIALLGADGEIVAVNRAWADFAMANGYAGGGTGLGMNYVDVCQVATGAEAEEAHAIGRMVRRVLAGEEESAEEEYGCPSPTEERWFRMTVRRMSGSEAVVAIVTHTALTEERLAVRREGIALALAEADRLRLQGTLDALPVAVWLSDVHGNLTHSNPAAARLWGGRAPLASSDDGYAEYKAWWPQSGRPVELGEWPITTTVATGAVVPGTLIEIERFDGTRAHIINSTAPIPGADGTMAGIVVVSVDVSELQAATRERELLVRSLELERARLESIFELAPSFVAVLRGPDHVFERANPAYYQLVGHRRLLGLSLLDAIPELVGQGFVELLDDVAETGVPFIGRQVPVQIAREARGTLEPRYVDVVYQRIVDADGSVSLLAQGVDVTDQVQATNALRRSEEVLREQFAKLPVATMLWELRGDDFALADVNDEAYRTFPDLRDARPGMTSQEFPSFVPRLDDDRRHALRENVVVRRGVQFGEGTSQGMRSFDVTIGPQQPNRVLIHWVDTTERVQLEAQLRQSQKLEAIGQLAGGIAHDFNNLLTVIIAYAGMLLMDLAADDENRLAIKEIEHAASRAADLTRQLLMFSRKQQGATRPLDLNASVHDVERLIPQLVGSDVSLNLSLGDGPFVIVADGGQVGQILMNLVVNANDAMPDGGTITIETAAVELDEAFASRNVGAHAGPHIRLRVSDTGHGMTEAVRARVFEPFFTTKAPGKGTGLGLSAVYGIVQHWNGYVQVSSVVGHGTTFSIYIPASDVGSEAVQGSVSREPSSPTVHGAASPEGARAPGALVLLVDDDDAVRGVAARVLRSSGHDVIEAASGIEALRLLDDTNRAVDVVLSDMVMPGMGGRDLAYEVRNRYPGAALVLMSGYTREILQHDDPLRADTVFIQKPFTPEVLRQAIREALASRRTAPAADRGPRGGSAGPSSRRALDSLVNGLDAVVWEADANSDRYHYVSRRAESLLGYPRERWHQEDFWGSVIHPDDRDRVASLRRMAAVTGEGFTDDYRLISSTGATVWIRDTVCTVPGRAGKAAQLGGVMFDVTLARDAMESLTRAKEGAVRADAAKSEFVKLVSHELHTPLNSVIGFANILRKNREGHLGEKELSYVERIAANGTQLLAIVRDLLDVTRMEGGTLEVNLEEVSIETLVRETVSDLEGAALEKGIALTSVTPAGLSPLHADPLRMRQVLTNLIGNAIKYTEAGSVVVEVFASGPGTPSRIEIRDTGQGIAADKLETVFNIFYQEESLTQRRHDGAGMGLGIARGLCERMGFALSISSEPGVGTTCLIDLAPR